MENDIYNIKGRMHLHPELAAKIEELLLSLDGWGSIEVQTQNGRVVQMTKRTVLKT